MQATRVQVRIAFAFAILCSLPMSLKELHRPVLPDFHVYLTAAHLVRERQGPHIYDEADTGRDPQLQLATMNTRFAQTAQAIGIPSVRLYVYPPALADALVPLAHLNLRSASGAWIAINLFSLLVTAWVLARLLSVPILSWTSLAIAFCVFAFRPNMTSLHVGQVSFAILLLWTLGLFFFQRGAMGRSAWMFALATAIKLTPLIVLLPMFLWREWKWVRWYCTALAACVTAMLLINGPATLLDYLLHVVPSMSGGIASVGNLSIQSALQVLYAGATGANVAQPSLTVSASIVLAAKMVALAILSVAFFQIYQLRATSLDKRIRILALVAVLSVCTAPVSWRHAYSIALLALLFLWRDALQSGADPAGLWLLTWATIECAFVIETVAIQYVTATGVNHGMLPALIPMLAPLSCLALVFYALATMRRELKLRST
jgi:hypothetical protein